MKALTIAQMKILLWLDENFAEGAVTVEFTGRETAQITDKIGGTAKLYCEEKNNWKITLE